MQAVVSNLCENMQAQSQGLASPVNTAVAQAGNAQAQAVVAQQIEATDRAADALNAAAQVAHSSQAHSSHQPVLVSC